MSAKLIPIYPVDCVSSWLGFLFVFI